MYCLVSVAAMKYYDQVQLGEEGFRLALLLCVPSLKDAGTETQTGPEPEVRK